MPPFPADMKLVFCLDFIDVWHRASRNWKKQQKLGMCLRFLHHNPPPPPPQPTHSGTGGGWGVKGWERGPIGMFGVTHFFEFCGGSAPSLCTTDVAQTACCASGRGCVLMGAAGRRPGVLQVPCVGSYLLTRACGHVQHTSLSLVPCVRRFWMGLQAFIISCPQWGRGMGAASRCPRTAILQPSGGGGGTAPRGRGMRKAFSPNIAA